MSTSLIGLTLILFGGLVCAAGYLNWCWFNAKHTVYTNEKFVVWADEIIADIDDLIARFSEDPEKYADSIMRWQRERIEMQASRAENVARVVRAETNAWPFTVVHYKREELSG